MYSRDRVDLRTVQCLKCAFQKAGSQYTGGWNGHAYLNGETNSAVNMRRLVPAAPDSTSAIARF